jgi:hypothetical protein
MEKGKDGLAGKNHYVLLAGFLGRKKNGAFLTNEYNSVGLVAGSESS